MTSDSIALACTDSGLELRTGDAIDKRGVRVDFASRAVHAGNRARRGHAAANQPLRRAIGRRPANIADVTAGFGDDACMLASLGHRVIAIERSPIVAELLADGLARALADPLIEELARRIEVMPGDARDLLASLRPRPDVIYIDPMYPVPPRKTALPRRQIQLLRRLVGDDADAALLFRAAWDTGSPRIVVKRPVRAEPLEGTPPTSSQTGKLVRYDVYQRGPQG